MENSFTRKLFLSCLVAALFSSIKEGFVVEACEATEFDCGNGQCILGNWYCDDIVDCNNGADELPGCGDTTTVTGFTTGPTGPTTPPAGANCSLPYLAVAGRCIVIETFKTDVFFEMEKFCREINGYPIELDDANYMYELTNFLKDNGLVNTHYWIGAHRAANVAEFEWLYSKTPVKMGTPYWAAYETGSGIYSQEPNEPETNEVWVMLDHVHQFYFNDRSLPDHAGVVCETR